MGRTIKVWLLCCVAAASLLAAASASAAPTVCASGCASTTIQGAIDAATPGATIKIAAGKYVENLTVDKSVTLQGAGEGTVVYPSLSAPVCPGGSEGSLCAGKASNIVLVEANNVTITKLRLEGDNPGLSSGVVRDGADIDARNGIITDHEAGVYNNLTVSKVAVSDIYLRGIYASTGGSFNFSHDHVDNVQGEEASIAMFNFGGSGVMAHNTVTNANDAISANWSTGTQFLDNVISKSGSGVHTDNNGGDGGSADLITGNRISECHANGYGIFVFVPYVSATVEGNRISGCYVGLAAFGGAVSGQGPTFTANKISGAGAATTGNLGTFGAYLTTDQLGFAFGDLTATLSGNSFQDTGTGLYATQSSPSPGQPAGGQATITASGNTFHHNATGANGETGTVVTAANNWWGCSTGPNSGPRCDTAIGTVSYTPWLTAKP